jgi:hypothetical protein
MQADPKHQQDDANLSELPGEIDIGDEARREGADGDAGQQVTDQWRQTQPAGHEAAAEARTKPTTMVAMSEVECSIEVSGQANGGGRLGKRPALLMRLD